MPPRPSEGLREGHCPPLAATYTHFISFAFLANVFFLEMGPSLTNVEEIKMSPYKNVIRMYLCKNFFHCEYSKKMTLRFIYNYIYVNAAILKGTLYKFQFMQQALIQKIFMILICNSRGNTKKDSETKFQIY